MFTAVSCEYFVNTASVMATSTFFVLLKFTEFQDGVQSGYLLENMWEK